MTFNRQLNFKQFRQFSGYVLNLQIFNFLSIDFTQTHYFCKQYLIPNFVLNAFMLHLLKQITFFPTKKVILSLHYLLENVKILRYKHVPFIFSYFLLSDKYGRKTKLDHRKNHNLVVIKVKAASVTLRTDGEVFQGRHKQFFSPPCS